MILIHFIYICEIWLKQTSENCTYIQILLRIINSLQSKGHSYDSRAYIIFQSLTSCFFPRFLFKDIRRLNHERI